MSQPSLIVFGPADGFRAFRMPEIHEVNDDGLAISSSELVLADDACALLVSRPPGSSGANPAIRVAIYRPGYEKAMKRRGQVFGAAFDFTGHLPDPEKILDVLRTLLELIEKNCVREGRFLTLAEFREFLESRLNRSVDLILKDVSSAERSVPILTSSAVQASYGWRSDTHVVNPTSAARVRWYATDPSAVQCSRLIIYPAGGAEVNTLLKPLPSEKSLLVEAVNRLAGELAKSVKEALDLQAGHAVTAGELALVRAEKDKLTRELNSLKTDLMREPLVTPSVPAPQPRVGLTQQDLSSIRAIVIDAIRDVATSPDEPERKPETGRKPLRRRRDKWLPSVTTLRIAIAAVAVVLVVLVVGLVKVVGGDVGRNRPMTRGSTLDERPMPAFPRHSQDVARDVE